MRLKARSKPFRLVDAIVTERSDWSLEMQCTLGVALQLIVLERENMHHSRGPWHPYANRALSSAPKRQCFQVWMVQARMKWPPWEASSGTRIKMAVGVAQLANAPPHWQPFLRPSPKCKGNSSTFSCAPHCHLSAREWCAAPA